MRTIFEVAEDNFIIIQPKPSMYRLCAEIFPYKGGLVFFDVFWNHTGHGIHVIPGPIQGDEAYWELGNYEEDGDITAYLYGGDKGTYGGKNGYTFGLEGDYAVWTAYMRTEEGQRFANKKRALEEFKGNFGI